MNAAWLDYESLRLTGTRRAIPEIGRQGVCALRGFGSGLRGTRWRTILVGNLHQNFPLLHDPPGYDEPEPWSYRIPIIGWMCGYARQCEREQALVNQAIERGPVGEGIWDQFEHSREIRQKIEEIVRTLAYPPGSTFHPLDPIELMFVLRYGDLNELQIIMCIEDEFGFEMGEELCNRLILDKTTFIDFIRMVEAARYQRLDGGPLISGA